MMPEMVDNGINNMNLKKNGFYRIIESDSNMGDLINDARNG